MIATCNRCKKDGNPEGGEPFAVPYDEIGVVLMTAHLETHEEG